MSCYELLALCTRSPWFCPLLRPHSQRRWSPNDCKRWSFLRKGECSCNASPGAGE